MKMTRVLFVTDVKPYPPHGGQRIRCYNLIDSLCQHFEVVVLAPRTEVVHALAERVCAWYELPRQHHRSLLSKIDDIRYILAPRPSWASRLREICQEYKPQVTWFSFGHWGQYAVIARRFGARAIMDAHNVQSDLTRQEYKTLPLGKSRIANQLRYIAQRGHEHFLFRRFDRIVSVCEADRRIHARSAGDAHSLLIPNYINEARYACEQPVARRDDLVVIAGSFRAFQNRLGTVWFLEEVWPRVRREVPRALLQIIGRGAEALTEQAQQNPGVTCTGTVVDVSPYLRRATVAAVPILHGSGTRFKILEALACGAPVVSTRLGAQGIEVVDGESACLADSPDKLGETIIHLLKNKEVCARLARNGLAVLKRDHDFAVNTERVRRLTEELASP